MPALIHDLLDLPEAVRKGDFVQALSDGIKDPEKTIKDYAIPAKIVQTFRHALSIINSALRDGRSQAAYLHGSFGSGKSHFMAVLDLLLSNNAAAWRRPELHPLRAEHPWIGEKKLLQLPIHMLGAKDMESKILGTYVSWVREHHPNEPIPAVFADDGLFADAEALRATMGDDPFFSKLNASTRQASSGWGQLASTRKWDAASFDAAVRTSYGGDADRDASSPRAWLFNDLVHAFFRASAGQQGRFVDLDTGLGVLSRHAKGLGYDAVVLYLDELVLWLAGNTGDLPFVGREVQKWVKLKEAQDAARAIPIISFLARQRDLAHFVGEQAPGAVRNELSRNIAHHEGRFELVTLEDSNLPAIVRHRVVRPKNAAAAEKLADDFAKTWRAAGQAQSVLIGSEGDEAAFRQVYPFSPALVEALVALSDCLQRERTAIRILMELLVDHLPDLELGRVVPVGDAFDALAESEDPIDDPVMKARFDRARDLYQQHFLRIIRAQHHTDTAEKCQRLREDHDRRLGCSRCPQRPCRDDNRLAKTLLMAALVPEAKPFKELTVKRLVHLNHGAIASPVQGLEVQVAVGRLKDWAGKIGAMRLGEQADPEVSIHLAGIDLLPILAQAAEADTPGTRKNVMRRLLFEALELVTEGTVAEWAAPFSGTKRQGRVRYGNVREMDDAALNCPADFEWQVVIDYPFDERGHGPDEDLRRLEKFRDSRAAGAPANPTVAWLPTFFSHAMEVELGQLVVLEHILGSEPRKYLGHLRVEDQVSARADLTSLRAQKEALVKRTLSQAYGLTMAGESGLLDSARTVDDHFVPLLDDLEIRSVLAGTMRDGFRQVVDAVLTRRYPHHPRFDGSVTSGKMQTVLGLVERLLDEPIRRLSVTKAEQKDLRAFSDPLGITETSDVATLLRERPFQDLEQRRQQLGLDSPTVGQVRGWLDPAGTRGLTADVQDTLIALYSTWSGRTLQRAGRAFAMPRPGQLPDDVELHRPELPTQGEWSQAIERAGHLFGATIAGRSISSRNLTAFVQAVQKEMAPHIRAKELVPVLEARLRDWADPNDAPRLTTAKAAAALVASLSGAEGAALVRALAGFTPATSIEAMSKSLSTADAARAVLAEGSMWIVFQQVKALVGDAQRGHRAGLLLADLKTLLSEDETNKVLTQGLTDLTRKAAELLRAAAPEPPPPGERVLFDEAKELQGGAAAARQLRSYADRLDAEAGELRVSVHVTAWKKEPGK